jgi:hypothetical protein
VREEEDYGCAEVKKIYIWESERREGEGCLYMGISTRMWEWLTHVGMGHTCAKARNMDSGSNVSMI